MSPSTYARVAEDRRQEALAWAAQAHRIAAAGPAPAVTPRTVGRLRAGLRQAVASLVALVAVG